MDRSDLLVVQGTLKSLVQHHSSKASILRRSAFFIVQLSHPYMTTGKTIALTRQTFVSQVMSLPFPSPGDRPNSGIEPRSPTLQVDSLLAEPQEEPKNTGVGSLSLLQRIFPTQKSNWGLLHCRWILYQLSYQGAILMLQHDTERI